ncbi:MAG: DUF6279 family lipoprotein [Casimicrobiaceae bacterium]
MTGDNVRSWCNPGHRGHARATIALLCITLALLGACSALRLGYNQADKLAYFWLNRFVDFDDAQAQKVREGIAAWFAWHRRTQLADYVELLGRAEAELGADTTAERSCSWWPAVRSRIDRAADQAVPVIASIAATLKPVQLQNIEKRYEKTNREYRDDFMQTDPVLRSAEAAKRLIDHYESIYGNLEQFQKERLERMSDDSPYDSTLAFEERRRRQQEALRVLRRVAQEQPGDAAAQALIRDWLQRFDKPPSEAYRLYADKLIKHNCRVFADLHNRTSSAQRQFAKERLRAWATDLRVLAAERID